jgi:hypothetical protein
MQQNGWRLQTNIATMTTILPSLGMSTDWITVHGMHFINDVVKHLTNHFLLKHVSSIIVIHRRMVKHSPLTRCWEHCWLNWSMRIKWKLGWTFTNHFGFVQYNIQSSYKIHTIITCLWITSFNAYRIQIANNQYWPQKREPCKSFNK